jgi:hypothetical protein
MPNVTRLIREVMQRRRVQQSIVEKDYALSYLLAAIAATDGLSANLVLKGFDLPPGSEMRSERDCL